MYVTTGKRLYILQLYGYFIAQKIKGAKTVEEGGAGEYCSRGGQSACVSLALEKK